MITNSYLQKKKYPSVSERPKSLSKYSSFSDSPSLHDSTSKFKLNISKNSEPLNSISRDLSFKGSPINGGDAPKEIFTIAKALEKFTAEFGKSAADHLEATINRVTKDHHITGISKDANGGLKFKPETTGKKLKEIILYPILKMPIDLVMGALETLQKLPGLKNSKFLKEFLNKDVFKNRRLEEQLLSDSAAVQNIFENAGDKKFKLFKTAHGRMKPTVSNYSTTKERSLTRFVTGMIPAIFLANDAYNLSMYMKNNKTDAKEEKKRRFNQEAVRIVATSALTFGILSFFAKKSNSSGKMTNYLMTSATFASEFVGRILAGNPVFPVGEESARKYAEKRAKEKKHDKKVEDKKASGSFRGSDSKEKTYKEPPEKGLLTLGNVLKIASGLIVFGFAVDKFKAYEPVAKKLGTWGKKFDSYFKKDVLIKKDDYNKLISQLSTDEKFKPLVEKYNGIIADQKDKDVYNLGSTVKKTEDIIVNKVLLYPFKFAWESLVMLPYKITKNAYKEVKALIVKEEKSAEKTAEKLEAEVKKAKKDDLQLLQNSVGFLQKIQNAPDYEKQVNAGLMEGLDNVTKSSFSNAKESATIRTTMQAVTSGFLIADSYNMVMIDSHGKDQELAEQKAKERTIQRSVRMAYSTLVQKTINGAFENQYNGSLIGAQLVNGVSTVITECLERKSVGLPIGESTRDEILETEHENLTAKGVKGAYYRGMAKLTGKKPMSERAAHKKA